MLALLNDIQEAELLLR